MLTGFLDLSGPRRAGGRFGFMEFLRNDTHQSFAFGLDRFHFLGSAPLRLLGALGLLVIAFLKIRLHAGQEGVEIKRFGVFQLRQLWCKRKRRGVKWYIFALQSASANTQASKSKLDIQVST